MDIKDYMQNLGRRARAASRQMAKADTNAKNRALLAIAAAIRRDEAKLLAANGEDLAAARAAGLEPAMVDRLTLSPKTEKIAGKTEGAVIIDFIKNLLKKKRPTNKKSRSTKSRQREFCRTNGHTLFIKKTKNTQPSFFRS